MRLKKCFKIIDFVKLVLIIIYIYFIIFKKFSINPMYYSFYKRFISDNFFRYENMNCDKFDPIYLMGERFKRKPIILCKNKESSHICFQHSKYDHYNKVSRKKYGVICKIKNFVLDPLKSIQTNYIGIILTLGIMIIKIKKKILKNLLLEKLYFYLVEIKIPLIFFMVCQK